MISLGEHHGESAATIPMSNLSTRIPASLNASATAAAAAAPAIDNGLPSASPYVDLQRVIKLIEAERHLLAFDLLGDVRRRLDAVNATANSGDGGASSKGGGRKNKQSPTSTPSTPRRKKWRNKSTTSAEEEKQQQRQIEIEKAALLLREKHEEFVALEVCSYLSLMLHVSLS